MTVFILYVDGGTVSLLVRQTRVTIYSCLWPTTPQMMGKLTSSRVLQHH